MLDHQAILEVVRSCAAPQQPVYLVGGAVRDLLLQQTPHDLDFFVFTDARKLTRAVAERLQAGYYAMDAERGIWRVVLEEDHPPRKVFLDFSLPRAADLESDLRARDFTINALAFDLARPDQLIDPTGGLADLQAGRIRACSPESMAQDPVRVLRGVRQAVHYQFSIHPQTRQWMRSACLLLSSISAERIRDELFRLLEGKHVALALRLLDRLGALPFVLPELIQLRNVGQSAPHVQDVWEHTLSVVQHLEALLPPLLGVYQADTVRDLTVGSAVLWLGRFREAFAAHFAQPTAPGRSLRGLLFFAALFHDVDKPARREEEPSGRVRFLGHETSGAQIAGARARELVLSSDEIQRLKTIVAAHMRVHSLAAIVMSGGELTRRAIYRFFQATGAAGVDVCLLSLADVLGTFGSGLPPAVWESELRVCRILLEAYWTPALEIVDPPRLVSGKDLMEELHLPPGEMIGKILAEIREEQAAGEISTREQALTLANNFLANHGNSKLDEV